MSQRRETLWFSVNSGACFWTKPTFWLFSSAWFTPWGRSECVKLILLAETKPGDTLQECIWCVMCPKGRWKHRLRQEPAWSKPSVLCVLSMSVFCTTCFELQIFFTRSYKDLCSDFLWVCAYLSYDDRWWLSTVTDLPLK